MKHRAEMSSFQDLQSEAQALASTGQLSSLSEQDIADEAKKATAKTANKGNWLGWLRKTFTGNTTIDDESVHVVEEMTDEKCPFCNTAVTPGIKFCLNCQHKFATAQSPKTMREGNSSKRGGRTSNRMSESVDVRNRTKASFNHMGFTGPQKVLTLVLLVIIGLAVAVTMNFKTVKANVEKMMGPAPTQQATENSAPAPQGKATKSGRRHRDRN
jgi:uncharacterized Zn finger protein (UPF0148 family)